MRAVPFADLLKQWLADAPAPGVARVQTHAEVGRWEHPAGVKVALDDGWALFVQVVATSGPGGHAQPPGPESRISWRDRYADARARVDAETAGGRPTLRGGQPGVRAGDVLAMLCDAVKRADHPDITEVEVKPAAYGEGRRVLRVSCADGSKLYAFCVGVTPPGAAVFNHPAYELPREYA